MADQHKQVKILSLTLRILLISGRIARKDLVRAAKIAAAEVRRQSPSLPTAAADLDTEVLMMSGAPYETQLA